jgi:serine/threonine-protein kinase RsbW
VSLTTPQGSALEIELKNQSGQKQQVVEALERFSREHHLPPTVVNAIDLALEEHLTNLMSYGFPDGREHMIKVRLMLASEVVVEVEDDGLPFNPLQVPEADTSVPLEKRPVGGLGIHLIRSFMDRVEYQTQGRRNILRMWKGLGA